MLIKKTISKLGSLLEVSSLQDLEESLTSRVIAAHGDVVRKLHNVDDARRARDAFAKVGIHYELILWVANDEKINHCNFYNSLLGVCSA